MNENPSEKADCHPVILGTKQAQNKVVTTEEAIQLINDGDTIATGGFVGIAVVEEIAVQIEDYFCVIKSPGI